MQNAKCTQNALKMHTQNALKMHSKSTQNAEQSTSFFFVHFSIFHFSFFIFHFSFFHFSVFGFWFLDAFGDVANLQLSVVVVRKAVQ